MMNLRDETLRRLELAGKKPDIVRFVALKVHRGDKTVETCISFDRFLKLADIKYDNGYGRPEINGTLRVLLRDGSCMLRREYDGSEWWEWYVPPESLPLSDDSVVTADLYE